MEEKVPLKQFEKTDQELIHDIIDMKILDANEPIWTKKRGESNDKYDVIQGEMSE